MLRLGGFSLPAALTHPAAPPSPAACRRSRYAATQARSSIAWLACPFQNPGHQKGSGTAGSSTGCSGGSLNSAPPAADPSRPRSKALIVTHDQLRFDLVHGIHRDTHHDQQTGSAKVKIHA